MGSPTRTALPPGGSNGSLSPHRNTTVVGVDVVALVVGGAVVAVVVVGDTSDVVLGVVSGGVSGVVSGVESGSDVDDVPDKSTFVVLTSADSVPTVSAGLLSQNTAAVAAPKSRKANAVRGPRAFLRLLPVTTHIVLP